MAASAGILMYRRKMETVEVLLVHPGGPYWRSKDYGAWSIPKGEYGPAEDAEAAARREFAEELGFEITGALGLLGEIRQRGGKRVTAFALEGDLDTSCIRSNSFEMEWPPRSGKICAFPEIDRAGWFCLDEARRRILLSQAPLLDRLAAALTHDAAL
ncbi:MAG: NUDIX domain-containing protein [Rhodomicrobium sp.]|nr:NUDIX domain-containing protein [Rhodomicrobium sp.]